jgi:single-strand DNA-binding protein
VNGLTVGCTGRLGGEAELRYLNSGKALLTFSIAVDQDYTATDDRPAPETLWVKVTAWGELAETLGAQLHKGSAVYVEGRLRLDRWQGKDGEPRCGLSVSAWRVDVHGAIGKQAPRRERPPTEGRAS